MKDNITTNPKPNQSNKESTPLYWLYQWEEWHKRFKQELQDRLHYWEENQPSLHVNYVMTLEELLEIK